MTLTDPTTSGVPAATTAALPPAQPAGGRHAAAPERTIELQRPRGVNIHASPLRRYGMKALRKGAPTTTRQAEVLNPAIVGTPTDETGVVIGIDRISGALVAHDPFTAYENKLISSPNVVIIGLIGMGKSSLLKTVYVERPLLLRQRRAVVIDKKRRSVADSATTGASAEEGEYAELTRFFGAEPYRFDPDAPGEATCLNLLDPVVLAAGGAAAQRGLLVAMAELAGGTPLDEWHQKALAIAHRRMSRDFETKTARQVPVIADLIGQLHSLADDESVAGARPQTLDRIDEASFSVKFRLERLLADDLAGMFDRETSKHVQLAQKLTTFDISPLPEDGPATPMVMAVVNQWLMGTLTRLNTQGMRTNFCVEEGWHLFGGANGRLIQSKSKLSRGLGLSVVAAIHHLSDIPPDSPAIAMIKEAQTVHLFRQELDDDIRECVRHFALEASNAEALRTLPQGDHLLKVGTAREVRVEHVRSRAEVQFTETDQAMVLRS